jgi:hypothetical protein
VCVYNNSSYFRAPVETVRYVDYKITLGRLAANNADAVLNSHVKSRCEHKNTFAAGLPKNAKII